MQYFSPAKVNLSLAVSGVRADGFHDLDSVVTLVSLGDDIYLERAEQGVSLTISGEGVEVSALPTDLEQNLAVRAVRLLEAEVGYALPTAIRIVKRIPLGGGLGGGSSNAATVLKGVNELWNLGLSVERLCELGAELGSDVALFLLDGTVRMRGRGERVTRLNLPDARPLTLVLVNDGTHCSTPQVYRALD
jgi:4-diphosphocytidyl-2-C-methyl-D-erythritol kinase